MFPCAVKPDTLRVNLFTDDGKVTRAGAGAKELAGDEFPFRGYENGCRLPMGPFGTKASGLCAILSPFCVSVNRSRQQPAVVGEAVISSGAEAYGCWAMLRNITNIKFICLGIYLFQCHSSGPPIKAIDGVKSLKIQ